MRFETANKTLPALLFPRCVNLSAGLSKLRRNLRSVLRGFRSKDFTGHERLRGVSRRGAGRGGRGGEGRGRNDRVHTKRNTRHTTRGERLETGASTHPELSSSMARCSAPRKMPADRNRWPSEPTSRRSRNCATWDSRVRVSGYREGISCPAQTREQTSLVSGPRDLSESIS